MRLTFIILFLVFHCNLFPQGIDISTHLTDLENGNVDKVEKALTDLKKKNPKDPSIVYLDALLTKDGKAAFEKYKYIYSNYPDSKYADEALYCIYSFYYSTGNYISANKTLKEFARYPRSPYKKLAEIDFKNSPFAGMETSEETVTSKTNSRNIIVENKSRNENKTTNEEKIQSEGDEKETYTIQAGAFSIRANAVNLNESFKTAGYYSQIMEKKFGDKLFNMVYLGKFKTEQDARTFLPLLLKKYNIKGKVVQIP